MEFVERLRVSAFDNLSIEGHVEDLQGWIDPNFESVIKIKLDERDRLAPLLIVEVGSWKGKSCVAMAKIIKSMGFSNFRIVCIDTWLGSPEFWTWGLDDATRGISLNRVHGYPTVFYTFTKNIKSLGHDDVVAPFPLSSQQAVDVFKHYKLEPDIVYIDASHEYNAVKDDIQGWGSILKQNGTIFGDDYHPWPGVNKAVNEFGTPELYGIVWSFTKNDIFQNLLSKNTTSESA
jgi:hypothetical protein